MRGNKRKDTGPEMELRRALRRAGFPGYRLQWRVPGRPDVSYPGRKVAIFVNGCFWHRCPVCDLPLPEHNREYWSRKFEANIARDARKVADLEKDGWIVFTVWECEIKDDVDRAISPVCTALYKLDHKV